MPEIVDPPTDTANEGPRIEGRGNVREVTPTPTPVVQYASRRVTLTRFDDGDMSIGLDAYPGLTVWMGTTRADMVAVRDALNALLVLDDEQVA